MTIPWALLQLADGSFPSGSFAHSAGLESALVLGGMPPSDRPLGAFLDRSLRQIGRSTLPFVQWAARDQARLQEIDDAYDATLPFAGPNRASRAQGRALTRAASHVWDATAFAADHCAKGFPSHHAPVFGAIFAALGICPADTLAAYLHGAARTILSAAVRLGLTGPLEAQKLHAERAELLDRLLIDVCDRDVEDSAQTSPLLEMFAALHDRLDGRMFQS